MEQKTLHNFLKLIVLFLIMTTMYTTTIPAQEESALIIEIYDSNDWNESTGTILYEGRSYDITVSTENETIVLGVNITVLGTTYLTNVIEPFVTIIAPPFEEYDTINITAAKEGYLPAVVEMTILKGELVIVADRGTIEEKKQFQVTVKDQENNPIEGALVSITADATPIPTDQQGIAYVQAPEVEAMTTTTIQVAKSGYLPGSTTIRVENVEGSIFSLSESKFLQILPILIALLVVIFSVLYVLLRQKRSKKTPPLDIQATPPAQPSSYHHEKQAKIFKNQAAIVPEKEKRDAVESAQEPRVEEIRIPVQAKKKETTILPEEQEPEPVPASQEKQKDEWFKGQDYMRYKIDEMTGKIDQKTDGKWFEGEFDTKYKIDEALKKNLKKKKTEDDDNT